MITYDDKVAINENSSIAEINKVTAGNMNEIKTVVNSLISNTYGTSQTSGYSQEYVNDYVKLVKVSYGQSVTIDAHSSTEINVSAPTITGYKLLGCVGGNGVGLTGLLVSSSYNDVGSSNYFNRWVFNARSTQGTWSDVEFILLYIKN